MICVRHIIIILFTLILSTTQRIKFVNAIRDAMHAPLSLRWLSGQTEKPQILHGIQIVTRARTQAQIRRNPVINQKTSTGLGKKK